MSSFTRTKSGISNYSRFYGAEFVVFTEGKLIKETGRKEDERSASPDDAFYYAAVFEAAAGGKRARVKCVGNKSAALDYAKKIDSGVLSNAVVVVDRDLEGVLSSPITSRALILTYGYSWENELWSPYVLSGILAMLTNGNELANRELERLVRIISRRLKVLSSLDIASQVNGSALLRKGSSLCGIALDFTKSNPVSHSQVVRLIEQYRVSPAYACQVSQQVLKATQSLDLMKICQGHFWSSVCRRILAYLYRSFCKDSPPSNQVLLNLALSVLRTNPEQAIRPEVFDRYRRELRRIGVTA